jgi:hypothetical protein
MGLRQDSPHHHLNGSVDDGFCSIDLEFSNVDDATTNRIFVIAITSPVEPRR